MNIIDKRIVEQMKEKKLVIIGGNFYIRTDGTLIACANGVKSGIIGDCPLDKFYAISNISKCSDSELIEIIKNIFDDSLNYVDKGIDFADLRKNKMQEIINKDIKDKVIDKNKYIGINYCKSEEFDKFTVMDFQRDGKAWIGRGKNKTTFTSDDIIPVVEKLKSLAQQCVQIR